DRLLGEARTKDNIGPAFFAIAFQRIPRDRGTEEQKIVEMRYTTLGAAAADIIDAGGSRPVDFGDGVLIESRRKARRCIERGGRCAHMGDLSSVRVDVIDMEIIEPASRAVALEAARIGLDPGTLEQTLKLGEMMRRHLLLDAVRAEAFDLALNIE